MVRWCGEVCGVVKCMSCLGVICGDCACSGMLVRPCVKRSVRCGSVNR